MTDYYKVYLYSIYDGWKKFNRIKTLEEAENKVKAANNKKITRYAIIHRKDKADIPIDSGYTVNFTKKDRERIKFVDSLKVKTNKQAKDVRQINDDLKDREV